MTELSRRSMIKSGLAAAVAATASVGAVSAQAAGKKQDSRVYDVVVIGCGCAGMAAAIEAKRSGYKVCILDKMPRPAGNTIYSGGIINAAGDVQGCHGEHGSDPHGNLVEHIADQGYREDRHTNDNLRSHVVPSFLFSKFSVGSWFPTGSMVANFSLPVAAIIYIFFTIFLRLHRKNGNESKVFPQKNPNIFPVAMHKSGAGYFMHST